MDELYSPSLLVQIFHSFPRTSLLYDADANTQFSTTDTTYSHGLILAGAIPLLLLLLTMIGFLIYYNCIKFKPVLPKEEFDNSACRCSMCVIGCFVALVLCSVGAAVYGNIEVKNAVLFGIKSLASVNSSLTRIAENTQESRILTKHLKVNSLKMTKLAPENHNILKVTNMTIDLQWQIGNLPNQDTVAEEGLDWMIHASQKFEWYRSIINYSLVGLIGMVCFFAILGLLFRSRCCLISTTFFGQISLIASYLYVGSLLVLEIALSDICIKPYKYLRNETLAKLHVEEKVFTYYMGCLTNENLELPYFDVTEGAKSQVWNVTKVLTQEKFDTSKNLQKLVLNMHLNLTKLEKTLDLLLSHLNCEDISTPVEELINSSCFFLFDGFLVGLVSVSCICFALTIILCAAPQAWKKLGQVDDYADDDWELEDAFRFPQSFRSYSGNEHSYLSDASGSQPKITPRPNTRTRKLSRRTQADSNLWDRPPPYSSNE